jgi:hypothetical protein
MFSECKKETVAMDISKKWKGGTHRRKSPRIGKCDTNGKYPGLDLRSGVRSAGRTKHNLLTKEGHRLLLLDEKDTGRDNIGIENPGFQTHRK